MLTIRLLRIGKKHQPSYKIVVTDKRNAPAGGRFVEDIGNYDPKSKVRNIKKDRAIYWLSVGAQASDTVHNMLVSEKIIDKPKRKIIFKKPEVAPEPAPKAEPVVATTEEESVSEEVAIDSTTEEVVPADEVVTEPNPEEAAIVEETKEEEAAPEA